MYVYIHTYIRTTFLTHITIWCQCLGSPYVFKWLEPSSLLFEKVLWGNITGIFETSWSPCDGVGLQMGRDVVLDLINFAHSKLRIGTFKSHIKCWEALLWPWTRTCPHESQCSFHIWQKAQVQPFKRPMLSMENNSKSFELPEQLRWMSLQYITFHFKRTHIVLFEYEYVYGYIDWILDYVFTFHCQWVY